MLSVYTNQQKLLTASSTTKVSRIESVDSELLDTRKFSLSLNSQAPTGSNSIDLELHTYTPDGVYLTGNHKIAYEIDNNETNKTVTTYQNLKFDTVAELEKLGITRGQYKLIYNLFNNIIGSYSGQKLWIKEISPSRRELRIQLSDNSSVKLLDQLDKFKTHWQELEANDIFDSFVLNFGFNETFQIINVQFVFSLTDPEIIVKLYNPLPGKYGEKAKLWISEELITPILDTISIIPKFIPNPTNTLAGPNFELEEHDGGSIATNYKNWNDLLSSNLQTSQQLIDAQFSGSLSGIKLNTSFRIFDNFVHYSSAVERVKNFKYKIELIEHFNERIQTVSQINGGDITQLNLADFYKKRNRVVSGFDDFEKYLFFESTGSALYTHVGEASGSLSIDLIRPWPKTTPVPLQWQAAFMQWSTAATEWKLGAAPDPYGYFSIQESSTTDTASNYYYNLLEIAEYYDKRNIHKLQDTIPTYLQESSDGEQYSLFINMVGQHFDIIWRYIKGLTDIHTREEHPKDGMADDMLYQVATSLGFTLLNGKSSSELWKYSLGVDENGVALKSAIDSIPTLTDEKNTKEIWRRIVNNLPYILKSKGTSRSIKALLSCFGIPSTVLTIKEYGGPSTFTDNNHYPQYVHDKFHYAWLSNAATGSLQIPSRQYINGLSTLVDPNTLEFRFKTDNNYKYTKNDVYNILSVSSGSIGEKFNLSLIKETDNDKQGTVVLFNSQTGTAISASNLEIFDNNWVTVAIESINNTGSLKVVKTLYGKQIYIASASYTGALNIFPGTITFSSGSRQITPVSLSYGGSVVSTLSKFNGHYQEIRLWSSSLTNETLIEHASSPDTYTYNVDRVALTTGTESAKPYEHLLQRFTLANKSILSGSFYQPSIHPNQIINSGSIFFTGYHASSSITFEAFEETYYTPSPSLGASSLYSNKVRIESSSLDVNARLNTKTRIEKSSFDRYSLDSNRIGVYFSPQTAINEDIFNQLGYFEIDDYIGDPSYVLNDTYTALNNFAINYWKKYENRNDFEAYFRALQIYDFTLFKYIKRLLPQRVNSIVGLVVEPNVLERNKVKILNKPIITDLTLGFTLPAKNSVTASGVYQDITTTIPPPYELNSTHIEVPLGIIYSNPEPTSENVSIVTGFIERPITLQSIAINNVASLINSDLDQVDKLGTNWIENKYFLVLSEGKYKKAETGSYNPIQPVILDQRDYTRKVFDYVFSSSLNLSSSLQPSSSLILSSSIVYNVSSSYSSSFVVNTLFSQSYTVADVPYKVNVVDSRDYVLTSPGAGEGKLIVGIDQEDGTSALEFYYVIGAAETFINNMNIVGGATSPPYIRSGSMPEGAFTGAGRIRIKNNSTTTQGFINSLQVYDTVTSLSSSFITSSSISYSYISSASLQPSSSLIASSSLISSSFVSYPMEPKFQGTGYKNARFEGSKLTGFDININSRQTVDGGPVVKVTQVSPNRIVFANNQLTTLDRANTSDLISVSPLVSDLAVSVNAASDRGAGG